jgi:hypothetical protein|tara:strand:- start:73 stop:429 length:357 start_codon:yes stop_codon:yes gene_type:complete
VQILQSTKLLWNRDQDLNDKSQVLDVLDTKTSKEEGVLDDIPTPATALLKPGPTSLGSAEEQPVDRKALIKQITDMLREPGSSHMETVQKPIAIKKGSRGANADLIKLLNANQPESSQ